MLRARLLKMLQWIHCVFRDGLGDSAESVAGADETGLRVAVRGDG